MNEKRFRLCEDNHGLLSIFDGIDCEDEPLIYGAEFGTEKVLNLLNNQNERIKKLERIIKTQNNYLLSDICNLTDKTIKEENEKIRRFIDE